MNGLGYLFATQWKNRLKAIFSKPASCIVTVVMAALMAFVIWAGNMGAAETVQFRPMDELYALLTALYAVAFAITAYNGISRGASLYHMADVNYLFSAPIPPKRVLFYGLMQQLGTSLTVGLFLLFQYSWMRQAYGISMGFLILTLAGYGAAVFLGQLTAMALYSFVSGHENRRRAAKGAILLLCAGEAAWLVFRVAGNPAQWTSILSAAAAQWPVTLFPVGGWIGRMVRLLSQGQWLGLGWLGAGIAYALCLAGYLGRAEADFYEDVLGATQRGYMTAAAQKEGKLQEALPDHIKVGKTGLNGGRGASAFYFKHRLEARRARTFLLDTTTLIFLGINLVAAYFLKGAGLAGILAFATYMQIFTIGSSRWVRELLMPSIYLAPDRPFYKLIWLLRQSMEGYVLEALLLFVPVGLMLGLHPLEIAAAVLCRVSFSLLFVAGNMVSERMFGGLSVKLLVLVFYLIVMLVLAAPGVVLAVVVSQVGIGAAAPAFGWLMALGGTNLLVGIGCLFLCRNILAYAELNQK